MRVAVSTWGSTVEQQLGPQARPQPDPMGFSGQIVNRYRILDGGRRST
jgi:hypothetical protein